MQGKQVRKTTTYTPPPDVTPGKAEKLAKAFAHDFEKRCQGITSLNENMRLSQLVEWYFSTIAPSVLKESTQYNKHQLLRLYVLPSVGNLKIKDITTARLDELWQSLTVSGRKQSSCVLKDKDAIPYGSCKPLARKCGLNPATVYAAVHGTHISAESAEKIAEAAGKTIREMFEPIEGNPGLDAVTVTDIRRALSSIFSVAVRKEIVIKNPVTNSTSPKTVKKEKPFLDDNQCKRLLTVLEGHENKQLRVMLTVLMYSGMRSGELCALRWEDVDFDSAAIFIRHTLSHIKGEYKLSSPKTKSSERSITVPPEILALLQEHKIWQQERKTALGSLWKGSEAVFTSEYGNWHNRTYLNTAFKRLLKKHGFPDVHIHDLRHACASLLINSGIPVKIISEHLGHADTRTTEAVYSHIFAATRSKASEAISLALGK
jgi:integrase